MSDARRDLETARAGVESARAALRDIIDSHGGQRHHVPGLEDSRDRSPQLKQICEDECYWNKEVARLSLELDKENEPMTTPINISDREVPNPIGWVVTHGHADPLVSELIFATKPEAEEWVKRNPVAKQMDVTLIPVTSYALHSQVKEMARLRKRAQDLAAKCEEVVSERNRYKERCQAVERDLEAQKLIPRWGDTPTCTNRLVMIPTPLQKATNAGQEKYPTWEANPACPGWHSEEGQTHTVPHPVLGEMWWPDYCVFKGKGENDEKEQWWVKHRTASGYSGPFKSSKEAKTWVEKN
jgi:hypothetical protein